MVAFTDRFVYTRKQRILISPSTLAFLESYKDISIKDASFFQTIESEKMLPIKDIENFLYGKLLQYSRVKIVKMDKKKQEKIKLVGEEGETNFIKVGNQKYYCNNILAVDGSRHGFATQLSHDLKVDFSYKEASLLAQSTG